MLFCYLAILQEGLKVKHTRIIETDVRLYIYI